LAVGVLPRRVRAVAARSCWAVRHVSASTMSSWRPS
jgi:hypothetical protein